MARVELSDYFEVLVALLEAFEKYPCGAMWVGGLLALAIVCYTFVSVYKSKMLKIEQAFNELARKEGRGEIARSWAASGRPKACCAASANGWPGYARVSRCGYLRDPA